jgi:hypothetical protein
LAICPEQLLPMAARVAASSIVPALVHFSCASAHAT